MVVILDLKVGKKEAIPRDGALSSSILRCPELAIF
jgi:hypothetical protein